MGKLDPNYFLLKKDLLRVYLQTSKLKYISLDYTVCILLHQIVHNYYGIIIRVCFVKKPQYRKIAVLTWQIPVLYRPRYWIFNTELETLVMALFVGNGLR
jgi:hypothetical protein